MLKKIGVVVAVAVAVTAAVVPAANAEPHISSLGDYLINIVVGTHHNTHIGAHEHDDGHHVEFISGSACDRGGATSAPGSITTLATGDSCSALPHDVYENK
jgi:hypothetical protein